MAYSNGCFYFDEDGHIVSHQYEMTLTRDSSVWMTVEPLSLRPGGLYMDFHWNQYLNSETYLRHLSLLISS